ncbi:hypothetical protein HDU67_000072 [Dinochytrium kinnereticum]|nr:hypothetical protein HDU67_000072 [Dinochytrium kinnereticum]
MERTSSSSPSSATSPSRSLSPARASSVKRASAYLPSIFGTTLLGVPSAAASTSTSPALTAGSAGVGGIAPMSSSATKARLRNDLLSLMNDTASSDVQLVVGDDRVEFATHRIILIARSDYFRKLLAASSMDPRSPVRVELLFLDPDAFRIVLRYLYTAEEEDEATTPRSEDWRLILECYRITEFLGIQERSPIYLSCFVSLFGRLSKRNDRESCGDMWASADAHQLEDVLVGCAPEFWRLFGGGNSGLEASSSSSSFALSPVSAPVGRGEVARLLNLGNRLEILVKVMNAIPNYLETPVGKFRIVRSWLMAQPPPPSPSDEDSAAEMAQQAQASLSRRASAAVVVMPLSLQNTTALDESQLYRLREEYAEGSEGSSPPNETGFSHTQPPIRANPSIPGHSSGDDAKSPPQSPVVGSAAPGTSGAPVATRKRRESYLSTITTSSGGMAPSSVGPPSSAGWRKGAPTIGLSKEAGVVTGNQWGGVGSSTSYAPSVASGGGSVGRSPSVYGALAGVGIGGPGSYASGPSMSGAFSGGLDVRAARQKVLTRLNLSGITATDLAEEVEPSGILSDRHLLSLYRSAALEKEHPPLWMPVPVGFTQSQNHHVTHHGGLGLGRRNTASNARAKTVTLTASHLGPGFVTYCQADPVSSGRHVWTVVPLSSKDGLIGIGVSADTVLGSGASTLGATPMSPMPSESFGLFPNSSLSSTDGLLLNPGYHHHNGLQSSPSNALPQSAQYGHLNSSRNSPASPSPYGTPPSTSIYSPDRRLSSPPSVPSTLVNLAPSGPMSPRPPHASLAGTTAVVSDALNRIGTAVTSLWQTGEGDDFGTRSRPSSPGPAPIYAPTSPNLEPMQALGGKFGDPAGFDPVAVAAHGRVPHPANGPIAIPPSFLAPSSSAWFGVASPETGNAFPPPPPPSAAIVRDSGSNSDYFSLDADTLTRSLMQHQQVQQGSRSSPLLSPATFPRGGSSRTTTVLQDGESSGSDAFAPAPPPMPVARAAVPTSPRFVGEDGALASVLLRQDSPSDDDSLGSSSGKRAMAFAADPAVGGGIDAGGAGGGHFSLSSSSPMEVDDELGLHSASRRGDDRDAAKQHPQGGLHPSTLLPSDIPSTPHPTPAADSQTSANSSQPRQPDPGVTEPLSRPPPPKPSLYFVNATPPSIQNPPPHRQHSSFSFDSSHPADSFLRPNADSHLAFPPNPYHHQPYLPHTLRFTERWSRIHQPLTAETDLLSLFSLTRLRETADSPAGTGVAGTSADTGKGSSTKIILNSQPTGGSRPIGTLHGNGLGASKTLIPGDPEGRTYLAYLKDLPGKLEVVKDRSLRDAVLAPPKGDPIPIRKFDEDTLMAAFTIRPGPIPGFDASVLGADRLGEPVDEPVPPPHQNGAVDSGMGRPSSLQPLSKPTIKLRLVVHHVSDYKPDETGSPNGDGEKKKKKKKRKHEGDGEDDGAKKKKKKKKVGVLSVSIIEVGPQHKGEDHDHHDQPVDIEGLYLLKVSVIGSISVSRFNVIEPREMSPLDASRESPVIRRRPSQAAPPEHPEAYLARHVRQVCTIPHYHGSLEEAKVEASSEPFPFYVKDEDAAVAIIDLSGYSKLTTILSERLGNTGAGADRLRNIINPYFDRLVETCLSFGGDIFKFAVITS